MDASKYQGTPITTAAHMAALLGRAGLLKTEALGVPVTILDARTSWGSTQVLVQPVNGTGSAWVALNRVNLV